MKIIIDQNLCCGSGECVKVCPEKAIRIVDGKAILDDAKCDLDGNCIPACPVSAIGYDDGEVGGCGF